MTDAIAPGNRCIELKRTRLLNQILPVFPDGNLLLLTGGPGTGKTFLIRQLLRHGKEKSAYIDLKKLSSDITFFVRQLERLFAELWPDIFTGPSVKKRKKHAHNSLPRHRINTLLDELFIRGNDAAVIAFDGCEVLADRPAWLEQISLILKRLPSFVSVVLSSSAPLKIAPLPSLRLQGKLLEFSTADLHFDEEETYQFLSQSIPAITRQDAGKLQQTIDGWPAALALFCLQYQKTDNSLPLEVPLKGISVEHLHDYLQTEILVDLSPEDLRIFCTAALLEPFDYELLGFFVPVSRDRLVQLFTSYSFLLDRVDDNQDFASIKFAHLYAAFFRSRAAAALGHVQLKKFHVKAGRYFQKTGLTDKALPHFIALEDWDCAVNMILSDHGRWLTEENYEQLPFWVDQLPESQPARHPRLAVLLGQAHLYSGNLDKAVQLFRTAHGNARTGSRDWLESGCRLCEVLLLQGSLQEGVDLAERIMERSRVISRFRAEAMMFQAIGLNLMCRFDECARLWRHISTIANSRFLPLDKAARSYLMAPKAVFYNLELGNFEESAQILDHAIVVFRHADPRKRLGWVLLFKGVLKLEQQQYPEAITWFKEAVIVSGKTNRSVHATSTAFLAYSLAAHGYTEEARIWAKRARPLLTNDLTLWAPIMCSLAEVYLSDRPEKILNELQLAWNLAGQRNMLLPMALTAYTAFAVRDKISPRGEAVNFCHLAAATCRQKNIQHREAQLLLYLHSLRSRADQGEASRHFTRAMTIISEKQLGYLLTDDERINGLDLIIRAIKQGIATAYFLELCGAWNGKGCEALIPVFRGATIDLKVDIAAFWARSRFRSALPHIERTIGTVKRKKTVTKLEKTAQQLKNCPPDPLHVRLLGPFTLQRREEIIPNQAWKRSKAKELFKLLCLYPDISFTLDQLTELFWPESSPDKARANLWSTVSSLKSTIEPELSARAGSSYLQGGSQTYRIHLPAGSTVDTIQFKEKAEKGFYYYRNKDNARAQLYFESAVAIYRDQLLPEDLYAPWTDEPREEFALLRTRVLRSLAAIFFERRDLDECIRIYEKIITLDLWDEESYFELMQCYVLQGRELEAIKVFRRCEKVLCRELDVTPNEQLQSLLQRIIKRRTTVTDTIP